MLKIILLPFLLFISYQVAAAEKLRIFTWEGYITANDIQEINQELVDKNYNFEAEIIETLAEDAEQMFSVIRNNQCDITFLTLFFIKMHGDKTSRLLQSINTNSPRLTNYKTLDPDITQLAMGVSDKKPLYIPWGGGVYGFYVNADKVKKEDIPRSVKDLWLPKWANRFSLNKGQFWYNVGLTLQALDHHPFYLEQLAQQRKRDKLKELTKVDTPLNKKLQALYKNSNNFWQSSTKFSANLDIVSSWGPEINRQNKNGGNWQLIDFKEGHLAWLDTINFVKNLSGKKLEAAEVVANYLIGKKVQQRIADELSMLPASMTIKNRGLLDNYPDLFNSELFVPPFNRLSYSIMEQMIKNIE